MLGGQLSSHELGLMISRELRKHKTYLQRGSNLLMNIGVNLDKFHLSVIFLRNLGMRKENSGVSVLGTPCGDAAH
jgi:hypothetical protein